VYHKMLVLLDGSKLAEVVFIYAQELSARLNINLELLHVCDTQDADQLPMCQAYIEHMAELLQSKAAEIQSRIGYTVGSEVKIHGKAVVGYPAEEILKYAEENAIDLIMLSTHGRSGIKVWDIGEVANKVVRASKIPVWLVPSELKDEIIHDEIPSRRMVIPLDGSKYSEAVIPHGINIAQQRGAETEIVLIHIYKRLPSLYGVEELKRQQNQKKEMKRYLDNIVKRIEKEKIRASYKILSGDPAETIINFVKKNPAQLIAMATYGHSRLSRMVFGSVAEQTLHLIKKTPILLIKP
jgi:nucleotide-binding universal stress UspA family protein